MASAVEKFLLKDYANSIEDICRHQSKETLKKLLSLDINEENIKDELQRIRDEREANYHAEEEELRQMFDARFEERKNEAPSNGKDNEDDLTDSDDDMMICVPALPTSQKRPVTIPAMFGRTSKSKATEDTYDDGETKPKGGRGRGRGSRGGRGTAARSRGTASRGRSTTTALNISSVQPVQRSTPARKAAIASQAIITSSIVYDDSDSN